MLLLFHFCELVTVHICASTSNSLLFVIVFFRTLYFSRTDSPMFDFIESCLRHKSEMVIYEAAHAIVNMKHTTAKELAPAVSVLQLFCSSPKPTLRFAAVRTLNKVSLWMLIFWQKGKKVTTSLDCKHNVDTVALFSLSFEQFWFRQ